MIKIEEQDPVLVDKIRKCAADMLEVADILKASGGRDTGGLGQVEGQMRRAAVQLYGYFPRTYEFKAPEFRLQLPRECPQTHTSNVHLADSAADIPGLL